MEDLQQKQPALKYPNWKKISDGKFPGLHKTDVPFLSKSNVICLKDGKGKVITGSFWQYTEDYSYHGVDAKKGDWWFQYLNDVATGVMGDVVSWEYLPK